MFTEDQRLYLEDVLGVSSVGMALVNSAEVTPASSIRTPLLILTSVLSPDEQTLLHKILGSVDLGAFEWRAVERVSLGDCPPDLSCERVLAFADYPTGKHVFKEGDWTMLPSVNSMMGSGPEVAARKKEAWSLLQQFAKERK